MCVGGGGRDNKAPITASKPVFATVDAMRLYAYILECRCCLTLLDCCLVLPPYC